MNPVYMQAVDELNAAKARRERIRNKLDELRSLPDYDDDATTAWHLLWSHNEAEIARLQQWLVLSTPNHKEA